MLSLSDNTMCSYSDDNNTLSVMLSLSDNTMCSYSDDSNTLSVMISLVLSDRERMTESVLSSSE
jgi:hypothetical protein